MSWLWPYSALLFGNDSQLNFVVPSDVPAGTADLVIQSANTASSIVQAPVLSVQPGIFFDPATGLGAIRQVGDYLEIYARDLAASRPRQMSRSVEYPPR